MREGTSICPDCRVEYAGWNIDPSRTGPSATPTEIVIRLCRAHGHLGLGWQPAMKVEPPYIQMPDGHRLVDERDVE